VPCSARSNRGMHRVPVTLVGAARICHRVSRAPRSRYRSLEGVRSPPRFTHALGRIHKVRVLGLGRHGEEVVHGPRVRNDRKKRPDGGGMRATEPPQRRAVYWSSLLITPFAET